MPIDLNELERLAAQASPGPWTVDKDLPYCFIDTDSRFLGFAATRNPYAYDNAAYIAAACNAVPELIARVRELERQRVELAELAIYGNGCFDCPLEDVCLYKEELVRDSAVCSRLLIEWVEKSTKEAGE